MCSLDNVLDLSIWKRQHDRVAEKVCLSWPQLSEEKRGLGTSWDCGVGKGGERSLPPCMYTEFSFLSQMDRRTSAEVAMVWQLSEIKVYT